MTRDYEETTTSIFGKTVRKQQELEDVKQTLIREILEHYKYGYNVEKNFKGIPWM